MDFTPRNFERMVEQDVREDIITPLLHRLGYAQRTENDIRRSHYLKLRYSRNYFGRQKPSTDQLLSGYADYILDVGGQIRWVIEAKPPNTPISEADIDQAFHYARHPEVRAVCFCLCPIASAQRLAERLAIDRMDLVSEDGEVSTDRTRMTTFIGLYFRDSSRRSYLRTTNSTNHFLYNSGDRKRLP